MFLRNSNLHIRRFEFKYLIAESELDNIRASISQFVEVDFNAIKAKSIAYPVKSLYFDDLSYSSYYEKLAGLKYRKKLRIRTYENNVYDKTNVFLEIKRRDDVLVFKDRIRAPFGDVKNFVTGFGYDVFKRDNNNLAEKFFNSFRKNFLIDTILISYKREAYFDKNNPSFRLTLDKNILGSKSTGINFEHIGETAVVPGYLIMEAKFNRFMPAWFGMVIKMHNLQTIAFSKYCVSLEACGILPKSDMPLYSWI